MYIVCNINVQLLRGLALLFKHDIDILKTF